jgi:hypothetical protein
MPTGSNACDLPIVFHIRCSMKRPSNPSLPLHLMWLVTLSQAEAAGKVADEQRLLLDRCQKSLVNGLLVCGAAGGRCLLLFPN